MKGIVTQIIGPVVGDGFDMELPTIKNAREVSEIVGGIEAMK